MPSTTRPQLALVVALGCLAALIAAAAGRAPDPAAEDPAAPPASERFGLQHWPLDDAAARGRVVYEEKCSGCHGPEGLGNGDAAAWLDPRPRNFQAGRFKFRTTPSGELPTIADIAHVVRCGLSGSAMRSFPLMPESARNDVAAYVRSLAEFGLVRAEVEYFMEEDDMTLQEVLDEEYDELVPDILEGAYESVWPVSVEQRPEMDADSIEQGRVLYEAQCVACHGATGRGDGSSSYHLRDWKDAPILPRDFTTGIFRAGSAPKDVFLRLRTGLNGTPMPAVYGSDEELWHLTHFILSLIEDDLRAEPHPVSCDAHAAAGAAR